jgi:hypothetical protein
MQEFFPTDVRVKVAGDAPRDADALLGPARRLLFMGLALQQQYGDARPVNLFQRVSDTTAIQVFLHGGQKVVTLTAVATPEKLVPPEPKPDEPPIPPNVIQELSIFNGWWKGPTQITVNGHQVFHQYKPTTATADALHLGYGLQDNRQLADETDILPLWSSMYAGSIKRVVQAIWGYGEIDLPTVSYITGTVASPTKRTPLAAFYNDWVATVGLYKASTHNHWIVEIGRRGVLAMPLILLHETTGDSYRASVNIDTRRIVEEFGGLPSGETFPVSDDDLTTAIAAGKVLQLLTAGDMNAFYADDRLLPYTQTHASWAFSESGTRADNVGYTYEEPGGRWNDGGSLSWFTAPRSAWGEHWRVNITLSTHNIAALPESPIGTGVASLERVHRGRLDPRALFDIWYPELPTGRLYRVMPQYWGVNTTDGDIGEISAGRGTNDCLLPFASDDSADSPRAANEWWGCNVHVFYEGETLRRVRWVCNKDVFFNWHYYNHDMSNRPGGFGSFISTFVDTVQVFSPKAFLLDGADDLRVPVGTRTPLALVGGGYTQEQYVASPTPTPVPDDYNYGGDGELGAGLIRDQVSCNMVLILPYGCREAAFIWRELEADDVAGGNLVWRHDLIGRCNLIGYLGNLAAPPVPFDSTVLDALKLRVYCDLDPLTSEPFWPLANLDVNGVDTNPSPGAALIVNAGPRNEFASFNGIIDLTSTSGRLKYVTSNMPTELTNLNPTTIGWLGSV